MTAYCITNWNTVSFSCESKGFLKSFLHNDRFAIPQACNALAKQYSIEGNKHFFTALIP